MIANPSYPLLPTVCTAVASRCGLLATISSTLRTPCTFASVLFGFYVSNFGSYNKTYGALAGVIVFLLWLWITNLALLFGAEVDAEIERGRELQAGLPAEEELQLPPKDDRNLRKQEEADKKDMESAKRLRMTRGRKH